MAQGMKIGDVVRNDLVEYEPLSVMHFRVLDGFNVNEFAQPQPGAYALAHTAAHDELHVEPPYHFAAVQDLRSALLTHLSESGAALAAHEARGSRWFTVLTAGPDGADEALERLKARFSGTAGAH